MDVIEGRGPSPALVNQLVQRLPDDSLTTALASGGREHFGWGRKTHMLAELIDSINQNTRACGNWDKAGPPKIPPYPRPKGEPVAAKPKSVKDIFARFNRRR